MVDGRQYQAGEDMDARARVKRLEAALRECEARLEARDREIDELRVELATTLRALRYLHNFPNAPAAHANAAKIIPSDAEFDRMARANDAALEHPLDEATRIAQATGQYDGQTGDALAALDRLERLAMSHHHNRRREHIQEDARVARQALTASGVPYVPESVRRLPEDWMQQAGQARRCLNDGKSAVYESCSRQLDKALASAPAVPTEYVSRKKVADSLREQAYQFEDLAGNEKTEEGCQAMLWCARQIRIEARAVAAAPTDGRE